MKNNKWNEIIKSKYKRLSDFYKVREVKHTTIRNVALGKSNNWKAMRTCLIEAGRLDLVLEVENELVDLFK